MICPTKSNENTEILLDYCAGTLDPAQIAEFDQHMEQCAECRSLMEAQRDIWMALEQWNAPAVSPDFDAALYARIAKEQAAPEWRVWLRRWLRPALPYSIWKPAVPLAAACALLAVGLLVRTPVVSEPSAGLRAEKVDIEQVETALEDLDLLTPSSQAPASSM